MVTLEGMREYGYGDNESWQPAVAARCLNAAKEYYLNAGVRERDSALYDQAVYMLAMHWYDNREAQVIGQVRDEMAHGVQSVIHQLAWTPLPVDPLSGPGYTVVTVGEEPAP